MRDRLDIVLDDPVRGSSLAFAIPAAAGEARTLGDVLASCRDAELGRLAASGFVEPGQVLALSRYADALFLLNDDGTLGALDPVLRFRVGGRARSIDEPLDPFGDAGPVRIEVDRTQTGYIRNWPAYLARRWRLRADAYARFVAEACGPEAGDVLRLDTPGRVRRFLDAVGRRIHAAPYETYSRYIEPCTPFRGADQALDRILDGDGGNCAEKAMALYFLAHAFGLRAELVLGGEEASGSFPYHVLRTLLDAPAFDFAGTGDAQRYWQHYAVLCALPDDPDHPFLCDVAGSNIPFLCLDADESAAYLDPARKRALPVTITLDPIRLYYHRLARRQDLPLDLYHAMENFIESIDLVQTIDNELGLVHTGDSWIGAIAHRGRGEFGRIVRAYERFVARSGRDPRRDLAVTPDLAPGRHPLIDRFLAAHPRVADRLAAADPGLRRRIAMADRRLGLSYVVLALGAGLKAEG